MNERIKKIARFAGCNPRRITGGVARYKDLDANLEKFAVMLLTECIELFEAAKAQPGDVDEGLEEAINIIKDHFGVE